MIKYIFFNPPDQEFFTDFLIQLKEKKQDFRIIAFRPHKPAPELAKNTLVWQALFKPGQKKYLLAAKPAVFLFFALAFLKLSKKTPNLVFFSASELRCLMLPALWFKKIWLLAGCQEIPPAGRKEKVASALFKSKFNYAAIGRPDLEKTGLGRHINLFSINPGIKPKGFLRQESIFSDLAQQNSHYANKNFWTIGSIVNHPDKHNLEILFHAAWELKKHIPNLQLTIIGDGFNRKQMIWQCQKLKIDSLTWFVGRQKYLGKWLNGFDLYVNLNEKNTLEDSLSTLSAMAYGLPVIAAENSGLNNCLKDLQNGVLIGKIESRQIIEAVMKLYQNKALRQKIKESNRSLIAGRFTFEQMAGQFIKISEQANALPNN